MKYKLGEYDEVYHKEIHNKKKTYKEMLDQQVLLLLKKFNREKTINHINNLVAIYLKTKKERI